MSRLAGEHAAYGGQVMRVAGARSKAYGRRGDPPSLPADPSARAARRSQPSADETARIRRLEEEIAGLRRSQRTRGLIEQAKGRLAERFGLAHEFLDLPTGT